VPDGSTARGDGSGGDNEEAAWLDLVARFDEPAPAGDDEVPWPDREDLAGPPVPASPADTLPEPSSVSDTGSLPDGPIPADPPALPGGQPWARLPGTADAGSAGHGSAGHGSAGHGSAGHESAAPGSAGSAGIGPGRGPRDAPIPQDPADEHYLPPPAPPLPSLDPITKGAWLALIGGPLYLIIAKAAGWTVSGLTAFLAVAAFVGGFAVLVLRMDSGPPKDRGGPDDGAVV
jgi:hypothetical protein